MNPIDPATAALLVMDLQPGIIGRIAGSEGDALMARTADAIATVRAAGGRVGYVRVAFEDADHDDVPAYSSFAALGASADMRAAMHAEAAATQVDDRVAPHAGDIVVRKTRVGPFTTTDLHEQLTAAGVTTLILAGLSTSGVVLSTVRQAADLDYRIVVLADCVADNKPDVHSVLLEHVFPRQGDVIQSKDLHFAE
jgi:nicotinamidase-related amidase